MGATGINVMYTINCEIVVLGAGPAGLAAAGSAVQHGAKKVIIIERDFGPGGILQQCIHPGFGLKYFGEELTGPEYAHRFWEKVQIPEIKVMFNSTAIRLEGSDVIVVSPEYGMLKIMAKAIVLATGCRERTRGALKIPGSRPAGIYTAGTAQRLINMHGELIGRDIVILGSGDIGMIMARRMTLEGAHVKAVVEIMPYLNGLMRNKVQCLDDFNIPLMLEHTVIDIDGTSRVKSVTISKVDKNRVPILETEKRISCDTLMLSVGLIPENEISISDGIDLCVNTGGANVDQNMQTNVRGVFACGNALHVNDLVDNVTKEGETAGENAALFIKGELSEGKEISTVASDNIKYVCPQRINCGIKKHAELFFRVTQPMDNTILMAHSGKKIISKKICPRVSPGEMEYMKIDADNILNLQDDIVVSARSKEE